MLHYLLHKNGKNQLDSWFVHIICTFLVQTGLKRSPAKIHQIIDYKIISLRINVASHLTQISRIDSLFLNIWQQGNVVRS